MMASATNGLESTVGGCVLEFIVDGRANLSFGSSQSVPSPASIHDLQQRVRVSDISFRHLLTSPWHSDLYPGINPGFFTINAISAAGSPPMLKNSKPFSSTSCLKIGWVAILTRWPCFSFNTWPSDTKGWTSPREPTTCMTMLSSGGAVYPGASPSSAWVTSFDSMWLLKKCESRAESFRLL